MKAHEVKVGERYVAAVGGQDTTVRVLGEGDPGWFAYNEATGRTIHVHSPRRFRAPVSTHYEPEPSRTWTPRVKIRPRIPAPMPKPERKRIIAPESKPAPRQRARYRRAEVLPRCGTEPASSPK